MGIEFEPTGGEKELTNWLQLLLLPTTTSPVMGTTGRVKRDEYDWKYNEMNKPQLSNVWGGGEMTATSSAGGGLQRPDSIWHLPLIISPRRRRRGSRRLIRFEGDTKEDK